MAQILVVKNSLVSGVSAYKYRVVKYLKLLILLAIMENENHLIKERLKKLEELRAQNINPYPYSYKRMHTAAELHEKYSNLKKDEKTKDKTGVCGRIMQLRRMGKVTFMHLLDESGKIQLYFREDDLKETYGVLKLLDIGDFIGAEGKVFTTKTGELSVWIEKFEVLCKAFRHLPEKYHGIQDIELRYRQRYLDLLMNPDVKELFIKRSRIVRAMREFLDSEGFMEVEVPILQPIYGGAKARPFVTHINEWDMKLFLSISPELYLKRLIVGGYEKVYTICKNFRNEGVDQSHNPEFTMMECYWAYVDYEAIMELTERMVEFICKQVLGTTVISVKGEMIDLKTPWKRITMKDAIKTHLKIDVDKLSDEALRKVLIDNRIEYEGEFSRGIAIMVLFEGLVEDKLRGPVHITDHPKESTPLCKPKRGNQELIERFESYILGTEFTNGYSELNDPVLQRRLLEEQAEQLRGGSDEAHPMDEDFIQAIEVGMPPCGGLGLGVDRLVVFLTGAEGIRDVIFFPTMRPEGDGSETEREQ